MMRQLSKFRGSFRKGRSVPYPKKLTPAEKKAAAKKAAAKKKGKK
jgi:hypothetical protein